MIKKTFILISFFAIINTFAQVKTDCNEKYEKLEAYYKTSFPEKKIFTPTDKTEISILVEHLLADCPSYRKEIYIYAEEMYIKVINHTNFGAERQQWTQYLSDIYDKYIENFPETSPKTSQKKIILYHDNNLYSSKEEALRIFDDFFVKNKHFLSVKTLLIYSDLLIQHGNQEYESSEYIKKINTLNQTILTKISDLEQQKTHTIDQIVIKKTDTDIASLRIATKNIDYDKIKFSCDELNAFFKGDFEKNKTNVKWLEQTLITLFEQECFFDNDFFRELSYIYYQLAEEYYQEKGNSESAFYMGFLAQQKKEYSKAIDYLNQSARLETDNIKKANIYYQISNIYTKKEKTEKKEYLEKALENNPKMITACISLANLYTEAERDCFQSDFEYQTRYYLALQLLRKFVKNNPKYQESLQKTITEYTEKAPTKKELKKAKMKGKKIKIGCWINQELVLP